jgi:hypothetical protein
MPLSHLDTILADVEFKSRKYAGLIRIEIRNHSGLGDMRTPSTPVLRSFAFDDLEKAAAFANILVERLGRPGEKDQNMKKIAERLAEDLRRGNTINAGVDLGAYGVYLVMRNEEVIQNFTYERPTTERVSA